MQRFVFLFTNKEVVVHEMKSDRGMYMHIVLSFWQKKWWYSQSKIDSLYDTIVYFPFCQYFISSEKKGCI
jgi:hypothetical protein